MSDAAALLAAIRAAPDDDAPRLIYADWLNDHGQPERAEFIRIQCELARKDSFALHQRELALLTAHHDAFAGPLAAPGLQFRFRRGFVISFGQSGVYVFGRPHLHNQVLRFFPNGQVIFGKSPRPPAEIIARFQPQQPGVIVGNYRIDPYLSPAFVQIDEVNNLEISWSGSFEGTWIELNDPWLNERTRYRLFPLKGVSPFQEGPEVAV
jgi:uncharacterized protein (TIGR02996 family)